MRFSLFNLANALVIALISMPLAAQKIIITCDALSGRVSYSRNGVVIPKPQLKKGTEIQLVIENYNNYLYTVEVSERHEDIQLGNGENPINRVQGFGFTDLFKSFSYIERPKSSLANQEAQFCSTKSHTLQEPGAGTGHYQLLREAWFKLKEIGELEKNLQNTENEVAQYRRREKLRNLSIEEVQKLKHHPFLPAQKIKQHATAILAEALHLKTDTEPSLNAVFEKNNDLRFLSQLKSEHSDYIRKYQTSIAQLHFLSNLIIDSTLENTDYQPLTELMHSTLESSEHTLEEASQTATTLSQLEELANETDMKSIMQIWYEYEAIAANDFSSSHFTVAEGDAIVFDISFHRKPQAEDTGAQEVVKLAPFKMDVHGGIKINTSLGFNFGKFAEKQYSYFVHDTVIERQEEDHYMPLLASYLHFYSQGRGNVSVGGSIGVGLPVGSQLDLSSAHLFVGPSLFFGKSDRFVLNLGLMSGKVKHLAKGLKPGSTFDGQDDEIPTVSRYALGYVMGLSFNLGAGK